jgi:hypothetical protein
MDPIDGLEKLARLIRGKAADKTTRSERRGAASKSAASARAQPPSQSAIEQELHTKVRHLAQLGATPQTINQAAISTMLAWEFGDELHNEPKFDALVQQVYRHIESEPPLKAAFEQIIEQLSR